MDSQYGEENSMESHTEDDYIITSHDITKTRHHHIRPKISFLTLYIINTADDLFKP